MPSSLVLATVIGAGALAGLAPPGGANPAEIAYVTRLADQGHVALTITNFGLVGNNFVSRSPSMEYPPGLGYEHLTHGGLWVGARGVDGGGAFIGVGTGGLDQSIGIPPSDLTEFTPAGSSFLLRSTDPASPFFSPDAVSEMDAIAEFRDVPAKSSWNNPETNRPFDILVRQEAYSWGSAVHFDDFVVLREVIRNLGASPLTDVWVGFYTEFASGPKNAYSTWPPTTSGSPLGSWYAKKLLAWDDSLRLLREHRCAGYPIPDGCQFQVTPAWAGLVLLTPPAAGQQTTLAAWSWAPGNSLRDQDVERYALMGAGTIQDLTTPDLMPVTGDPAELLALGPFATLAPGDSITVDFAFVGGGEIADIRQHARAAQVLRDAGYDLGVVAVGGSSPPATTRIVPLGNPQRTRNVSLAIELSGVGNAVLELFDLAGRRLARREVAALGSGRHTVRLDLGAGVAPRVCFARLTEGGRTARAKVVLAR